MLLDRSMFKFSDFNAAFQNVIQTLFLKHTAFRSKTQMSMCKNNPGGNFRVKVRQEIVTFVASCIIDIPIRKIQYKHITHYQINSNMLQSTKFINNYKVINTFTLKGPLY